MNLDLRELLKNQQQSRYHKFRDGKDLVAKYGIAVGGVSVIIAVVLIFFYLLYVVLPIFKGAELHDTHKYQSATQLNESVFVSLEEYGEIGISIESSGRGAFFNVSDGSSLEEFELPVGAGAEIVEIANLSDEERIIAALLSTGEIYLLQHNYKVVYPNDKRTIIPSIAYPFGEESIATTNISNIRKIAGSKNEESLTLSVANQNGELEFWQFAVEESFLSDDQSLEEENNETVVASTSVNYLMLDPAAQWVYAISNEGEAVSYRIIDGSLEVNERIRLFAEPSSRVSTVSWLLGGISLLISDEQGNIDQWFPVRDELNQFRLNKIRSFAWGDSPITKIVYEKRRKGFYAVNAKQEIGVFYATSHRQLIEKPSGITEVKGLVSNPRSNVMLVFGSNNEVATFAIDNEHPDLSWSALWGKVWYENYEEPEYTWQSSASNTDFEAKFSLVPLSFGTLKAAFYAMLFAMPLAICGAIFTAYFMAPKMRQMVKPTIEIMEALPTVILGFLAGLWLAPTLENNLPGIFTTLILLPVSIIAFGLTWQSLPANFTHRFNNGWQAALLLPVIIFATWFSFSISEPVEAVFFAGDMPAWIQDELGLRYDQRNSLVVGIAMGFAVIPTIFSITEDAIFSVPKHLTNGSLALGASPWQTMVRVVLTDCKPGYFLWGYDRFRACSW